MKWKDSNKTGTTQEEPEQDYHNELEYSPWERKKISSFIPERFKTNEISMVLLGLGLLLVILIVAVVAIPRVRKTADVNQIKDLEARLQKLEDRLNEFEGIDEKLAWLGSQDRKIDRLSRRVAHLESSMSKKMNQLTRKLDKIPDVKKGVAGNKDAENTADKSAKSKAGPQYHQVKAGDTLYSISRRFGFTVDGLRKLNKLTPETAIYPGQKLLIKP